MIDKAMEEIQKTLIEKVFDLRREFVIIGLTGRTGSGCSTIADFLGKDDFKDLKSNRRKKNEGEITNGTRKDDIVWNYIQESWEKGFVVITASDIIFYFILLEEFETFKNALTNEENIKQRLNSIKDKFDELHKKAIKCNEYIEDKRIPYDEELIKECKSLIFEEVKDFRKDLNIALGDSNKDILPLKLQEWGNTIRIYDSIIKKEQRHTGSTRLAHKINRIIKRIREDNKEKGEQTHVVIDALRNPFEVLYFRGRYAAFYMMAINTDEKIRRDKLYNKGYNKDEIDAIDENEKEKKKFEDSYSKLDIDKCIELADIHLTHDGTDADRNRDLVNQLFTYVALILHPGLVPPTPLERVMQIAYTAKLNSGCLSRQVGAAVTNESYSVQSVGWNTVAEGQVPCSLRNLYDLCNKEDDAAYSNFEKNNKDFSDTITSFLLQKYENKKKDLKGLNLSYCFKDVYTSSTEKQDYNQVHTRSLHAEENAFLQLAKYGTQGIKGGKLFTTASCCELCAKKAYQLGIEEIYYIDAYPGISKAHILESGVNQPKMILFRGAIGRAYINLYSPFLPLKDEIEVLSEVDVKDELQNRKKEKEKQREEKEKKK